MGCVDRNFKGRGSYEKLPRHNTSDFRVFSVRPKLTDGDCEHRGWSRPPLPQPLHGYVSEFPPQPQRFRAISSVTGSITDSPPWSCSSCYTDRIAMEDSSADTNQLLVANHRFNCHIRMYATVTKSVTEDDENSSKNTVKNEIIVIVLVSSYVNSKLVESCF
ncbi:hypothetical protein ABZP36_001383 [Zizania latifolia]